MQAKAVAGGAHCNPSNWGPSLSGYSGSVRGFLVLLLVNLNQHQAGAGEGIGPSADTGDDRSGLKRLRFLL